MLCGRSWRLLSTFLYRAFVCDISRDEVPSSIVECASLDFVTLIFALSAIPPARMVESLRRLYCALKPGGSVCCKIPNHEQDIILEHKLTSIIHPKNLCILEQRNSRYHSLTKPLTCCML